MYTIFFHLSGLALIETLFYFLYIGPMETEIFENAISDAFASSKNDASEIENIYIINPFNNSNYITIGENTASNYSAAFKEDVDKAENKRIKHNKKLFNKALYTWSIIMSISLLIFIIEMSIKYYLFKKNKILNTDSNEINSPKSIDSISDMSIEMVSISREQVPLDIRFRGNSFDSTNIEINNDNDDNIDEINTNENNFFNFKNIRKNMLTTTLHYSTLIVLIVSFEYWFFNNIILKYDIVSMEELEYVLYENFYPILSKMVIVTSEDNIN